MLHYVRGSKQYDTTSAKFESITSDPCMWCGVMTPASGLGQWYNGNTNENSEGRKSYRSWSGRKKHKSRQKKKKVIKNSWDREDK